MRTDSYSVFADFYDELMSEVDYPALADYFDALIHQNGVTSGILLDLACGTGTLSALLAQRGWDVIGADVSAEMLSHSKPHGNLSYIRQDMTELDLFGTIDAAVCALDGLNHLTDESELAEALRRVSLFMNAGGVFVFDVNTLYKHETILSNHTFIKETPNLYCVWDNHYSEGGTVDIELNIFARRNNAYSRHIEVITERAYDLYRIRALCEQMGFSVIHEYDFLAHEPPQKTSEKVVFVCRKVV
ncbi:MAG: class I SAM-dependent methyltransferase [Oscillospiraceae bacterium]|nr:class I SAM-dependent methyltransferase [Oscillospiraceae bacterium]